MNKLMCHIYFGDPNPEFSIKLAQTLLDSGADGLEIGIPYSDPVADGVVFQNACKRALKNGMNPDEVLRGIGKIRETGCTQPIYITSYYAPIFTMGEEQFVLRAKESGANGLIIPDLLFEEQKTLRSFCNQQGLSLIQFATPYTSKQRLRMIAQKAKDFLYCIGAPSVTGKTVYTTEQKVVLIKKITKELGLLKKDIPLMIGFGISQATEVQELIATGVDGVIVGSAIARIYEKHLDNPEKALPKIASFIKAMKKATIGGDL